MKKISIIILVLVATLASCKKTPEVNLKYVDVERDLITVGTTTATVQCDYQYIATLKKAYFYYGEGQDEADMNTAEMRVVQNTLYVDLTGLRANTTYSYYYEFHNGFNSMRTAIKTFKTEASPTTVILPTVVTASVTEITTNSAKGGGEVTNDGGAEVTDRGICWSTSENPSLSDNHVAAGTGMGAFTAMMDNLEANTTYHVRAYATNEAGTAYGLDREFMTVGGGGMIEEYIDLCLPSGTLWATCNVGANFPEEFGDYFAWGETEPKTNFTVGTYKYCNGDFYSLTKYCNNPTYGSNGFTDNLIVLLPEDDAAIVNLGENWSMPTKEQWQELFDNTDTTWTTQNGVFGLLLTSSCNSLFLPAAGHYNGNNTGNVGYDIEGEGSEGLYWSSSLDTNYPITAWMFSFSPNGGGIGTSFRYSGQSIRPVRKTNTPTPPGNVPEGAINGLFTINAEGDQVYFSQGNLQYQASTNTWRFAEHQWDFVGGIDYDTEMEFGTVYENGTKCDNSLISSSYEGWIDLFGWGTSGWDNGNIFFNPYDYQINDDYVFQAFGYGPTDGHSYNFDLTGVFANSDWGVFNPMCNGGNQPGLWRTLTINEFEYLLFDRVTNSGTRFVKAKVNDVNGLILFPDIWENSLFEVNSINSVSATFEDNVITLDEWVTLFEPLGAVLMPTTGFRFEKAVSGYPLETDPPELQYWTSSSSYVERSSRCVLVNHFNIMVDVNYSPCHGLAVRLVQDAN